MDANPYTLKQILGPERRYIIPTFQRDYEWTKEGQWQLLFDDLEQVAGRLDEARKQAEVAGQSPAYADKKVGPHFLGAVVLDQLPSPAGGIDIRAVIDGQQRLTTVQLMLRGILDSLNELGSPRAKQVRRLLENPDDVVSGPDERHKLWPRRRDRQMWRTVMTAAAPVDAHPYVDARRYFHERANVFIADGPDAAERAVLLVDAALDLFKLVVIDLEENDDAQVIFEVLNGRQTPLAAADLVKNLLFLRAETSHEGQLDELYEQYWAPFDDPWWKKEVGIGHAARRQTEMLLAAWLTASTGEEASPGRLYGQIRSHLDSCALSTAEALAEISRYGHEYRVLNGAEPEGNPRIRVAYERLVTLGITTANPLLLWLRALPSEKLSAADHVAAVIAVESFVIRRMLVGSQTRGYGQIFIDVLKKAREAAEAGTPVATAIAHALASNKQSWPSDAALADAFASRRMYGYDAPWRIRLVLAALDARMRAGNLKMEPGTVTYDQLTVEHVMPQSWRAHWPLPELNDVDLAAAAQQRDARVNCIGNLTLVTGTLNPALSNGSWATKRDALQLHSGLALNKEITNRETWDEAAISQRAQLLAGLARLEWPGPPA
jgi:hypothetical protein